MEDDDTFMWITSCFEYARDIFHVEDRAGRVIQRARMVGVVYSPEELKEEILELMKQFTVYDDEGLDPETSLPRKIAKVYLSKGEFPIFLVIIEDREQKIRMLKTVWTDQELIKNGKEEWKKRKKRYLPN